MRTEYKMQLGKSYMVLETEEKEDDFAVQMLEENQIRSLLPFERQNFNGEWQYFYDVTGMSSWAEKTEKHPLGEQDVYRLLQGLYCVLEEIHSYFLEADGLLLRKEYIYEKQERIYFCFYPSKEVKDLRMGIETFATELLDQIDNADEEAMELVYQFYALAKNAKKGILYVLEEVLTREDPVEVPLERMQEILSQDLPLPEEEKERTEKKPDVFMIGCFGLSFLCYFACLFFFPDPFTSLSGVRIACGICMVICVAAMVTGWAEIDIKAKK